MFEWSQTGYDVSMSETSIFLLFLLVLVLLVAFTGLTLVHGVIIGIVGAVIYAIVTNGRRRT